MLNLPHLANPVLSKEEAYSFLEPYFPTIRKILDDAWAQWLQCPDRHKLDNRARAAFVNAIIVHEANIAFANIPGVKPVRGGNTFWVHFGDQIKTRFKKLDNKKRYRNYPTTRQLMLEIQANIPGILPGTYLTLGYKLDDLEQKIAQHLVTLQVRKKVIYEIDIDVELGQQAGPVLPMPTPIQPAPTQPRVRPRRGVAAEIQKAKGNAAGTE